MRKDYAPDEGFGTSSEWMSEMLDACRAAIRTVAAHAEDAEDCARLLSVLGLNLAILKDEESAGRRIPVPPWLDQVPPDPRSPGMRCICPKLVSDEQANNWEFTCLQDGCAYCSDLDRWERCGGVFAQH